MLINHDAQLTYAIFCMERNGTPITISSIQGKPVILGVHGNHCALVVAALSMRSRAISKYAFLPHNQLACRRARREARQVLCLTSLQ